MIHGNEVRTPAHGCPACQTMLPHTQEEFKLYHPEAGTGIQADTAPIKKKEITK